MDEPPGPPNPPPTPAAPVHASLNFPAEPLRPADDQPPLPGEADSPPTGSLAPLSFPAEAPRPAAAFGQAEPPRSPAAEPPAVEIPAEPPVEAQLITVVLPEDPGTPGTPGTPDATGEPGEPADPPPPTRRWLAPGLAAVAALLTAGGCVKPLFRLVQQISPQQTFFTPRLTFIQTAWSSRMVADGQEALERPAAPVGIALLVAVAVLAVAAVAGVGAPRLGQWLTVAGTAFAAGVALTIGMSGFGWSSGFGSGGLAVSVGTGLWLVLGGVAVAAVATVLGFRPVREPEPDGLAITVLPPEPA